MTEQRQTPRFAWLRQLFRAAQEDDIAGEAAKLAYHFFLSLFPLLIALFAVTGLVGGDDAFQLVMERIREFAPGAAADYLGQFVAEVTREQRPGLLTFGIVGALWAASNFFSGLATGLNAMYDIREDRPWWKRKALAVILVLIGVFVLAAGAAAILAGPSIARALGLGGTWNVLRWPLAFVLLVALLWLSYYWLPNRDQRTAWKQELIGAAVGAGLWLLATFLFRLYVANFGSYSATYGFVGAVIVLLIWLYITALAMLFGGEVAAELERNPQERRTAGTGETA